MINLIQSDLDIGKTSLACPLVSKQVPSAIWMALVYSVAYHPHKQWTYENTTSAANYSDMKKFLQGIDLWWINRRYWTEKCDVCLPECLFDGSSSDDTCSVQMRVMVLVPGSGLVQLGSWWVHLLGPGLVIGVQLEVGGYTCWSRLVLGYLGATWSWWVHLLVQIGVGVLGCNLKLVGTPARSRGIFGYSGATLSCWVHLLGPG
jgi:hypothetical protein